MNSKQRILVLILGLSVNSAISHGAKVLHPDFPVVEGRYQMTQEWSVSLPEKFNRRIEGQDLVIWRSGVTVWIAVWGNDQNEAKDIRMDEIRKRISPNAFDIQTSRINSVFRLSYRLKEGKEQGAVPAYYCYAVGDTGYVQMAIYLDNEKDAVLAKNICGSLVEQSRR